MMMMMIRMVAIVAVLQEGTGGKVRKFSWFGPLAKAITKKTKNNNLIK